MLDPDRPDTLAVVFLVLPLPEDSGGVAHRPNVLTLRRRVVGAPLLLFDRCDRPGCAQLTGPLWGAFLGCNGCVRLLDETVGGRGRLGSGIS